MGTNSASTQSVTLFVQAGCKHSFPTILPNADVFVNAAINHCNFSHHVFHRNIEENRNTAQIQTA